MRTVMRFSKDGAARYISHLDLMRAMNRAIRRAGIPAKYSQGFHPHIEMSFAQALGLGYRSEGEYMEIALEGGCTPAEAAERLNGELPPGILITGAWTLAEKFPTLMAAVAAARWRVEFSGGAGGAGPAAFRSLLGRDAVDAVKEGRSGPAHVDIRPGVYTIEEGAGGVELTLAAGSAMNIRPELVIRAALGGGEAVESITRLELYARVNERLVPLYRICSDGETYGRGKDHIG